MSGLCGWRGFAADEERARERIEAMAAPLGRFDGLEPAFWAGAGVALAAEDLAHVGTIRAAVAGRPRFASEQWEAVRRERGAAAAFAEAYRERGSAFLADVLGTFAVALFDEKTRALVLATDRLGVCPLYYQEAADGLAFGSTSASLAGLPADVDPQGLLLYLYHGNVPSPASIFSGRGRLQPGEYLLCRDGRSERRAYWQAEYNDTADRPTRELEEEFLAVLHQCVGRAAAGAKSAAFLSGGLDSSSVAGALRREEGHATAYSIGFQAEGYDEMSFARAAAKHFGLEHREHYVTADEVVEAIPRVAEIFAEPFGNESAVPAFCCARLARSDGFERLLAGDGGDEIFGGNERYSMQLVFGLYDAVPGPLRNALSFLLDRVPYGEKIYPVRRGRGFIRYARLPMPDRLQFFNLVERIGPEAVFAPELLGRMDLDAVRASYRATYEAARAASMVNKMLALDMKFTLADNDLPKVRRACELARIPVAFPMLDDAMVGFANALPAHRKVKIGRLRPFMRRALRDFLPREVLAKSKHGFGLPFGVWLRTHTPLQELARTSLTALRGRGIFKESFLDEVVKAHESEDAAYYGAKIWHLMMLEQWYQRHVDRAAEPVRS